MRKFTSVKDVTDIDELIKKSLFYKSNPLVHNKLGLNKRIGCIFMNPSMRTRLSIQIAAQQLGMTPIILNAGSEGWMLEFSDNAIMNGTTVEHIKDAAPILGSYFDILAIRTFASLKICEEDYSEHILNQFIKYSKVPVISLESATLHPLQSLADLITISEEWKSSFENNVKPKIVLTWAPHIKPIPQAVANSFSEWIIKWGKADFVITHPENYELPELFTPGATITSNQNEALKNADFVYVKNWSSFNKYGEVLNTDKSWMLTNKKLEATNNAKVMHCLPTRRNVELSDEVLDSKYSIVTKQAVNRIWSAQTIISEILNSIG